jgi:hypothetical protein
MKWFLDTEFHEDGRVIDLISIALVCEDGREYYAVSSDFNPDDCSDWVKSNVLPYLPPRATWKTRAEIASEIEALVLSDEFRPEFWAYFADYDWVALCQLYGRMIDLPKGFPFYCNDLKQEMARLQFPKPPGPANEHDALVDARWNRNLYFAMVDHPS